jgi:hypothetical protein
MKGMEGAPMDKKEVLDFESGEDGVWRMKAEEAVGTAKELTESIQGFSEMSPSEQVESLKDVMSDLATDNDNRFVVEALAKRAKAIEATETYRKTMEGLGVEVGDIINETA